LRRPQGPARLLGDFVGRCLSPTLSRQGFASTELITRWPEIVGADVAPHAAPICIKWPRGRAREAEPATLVLRVNGPVALEIQHASGVIVERINRFFGWRAIGKLALQQGPLMRREMPSLPAPPSPERTAAIAADLTDIVDEPLRFALARLGAAIKPR
jgi:hypothetical protein